MEVKERIRAHGDYVMRSLNGIGGDCAERNYQAQARMVATARGQHNHVAALHHFRRPEARGEVAYQNRAGVRVEGDRHQLSCGCGKPQPGGFGRQFPVLDFFDHYAERKGLGLYRGLFGGYAVYRYSGQFGNVGNPAAVCFAEQPDRELHRLMLTFARWMPAPFHLNWAAYGA